MQEDVGPGSALSDADMVPLLLLPLLWGGSLQEKQGYELRLKESVTVQEGLCVHVPCSFSYPWNLQSSSDVLHIYWYQSGDNIQRDYPVASNNPDKPVRTETANRFRLLEDPRTNSCSLSISNARRSDTGTYFFRVERGYYVKYTYTDKKLHLQVTERLVSGRPTRVTCNLPGSCEGGRPLTFSWVGAALDSLSPRTLRSSVLTLTLRPWDHGTNLTCQVKQQGYRVTMERTILLNVSYAPQNLTIRIFRNVTAFEILQTTSPLPILEGQALRLLCAADSNPPAELSWFRGSPPLNTTPISSTEILDLPRVGIAEEGEFTCQARHPLGSPNVSLNLSVHYPPQVSCSWGDKRLHCSCSSRAQPAPSLRWRLREQLLERNFSNTSFKVTFSSEGPWANSSLSLSEGLSSSLRLSCEAENVHGTQSVTVLLLPGKSVSLAGVVPGALGGAGAMALLSLCSCLIFFCIVKARRKQASRRLKGVDDEDAVMGTVALGSKQKPQPDSPPEQVLPAGDAPSSGEQQEELHYANLSFHGIKLRDPQDQEATSTCEYSEINTRK
ncbi:sialic acid-binding Ig-like lectin 5 isoform X2 [Rhinolophus sinicus]|uniref:sialic acid-binding Ig-like lectin 5 isoform X2 n=1 Tax=Rhinolophus sinicus TaxID=89399 RepID=UPI003D7B21B8